MGLMYPSEQPSSVIERLEYRRLLSVQPIGSEFQVNTYTTGDQRVAYVDVDADGDFVVAWNHYYTQPTLDRDIHVQRYNRVGSPQGGEFRANTFTPLSQFAGSVALDDDGDFVVAWASRGQDGGGYYGIYAQRYNAAGVPQGDEFRVNTYTTSEQLFPDVAMDADGDFVVAWQSSGQDGSGDGVFAQRYNAAGVAQGAEFQVNTYTTQTQSQPSVAMDAAGNFVVVWRSGGQIPGADGFFAQRYSADGVPLGGEFRINLFKLERQHSPFVAMDRAGAFVVVWNGRQDLGTTYDIYARRFSASGTPQGDEFRVNTYTSDHQIYSSVSMSDNGRFVVVWESSGQDGSDSGVYGQFFTGSGSSLGAEFRINDWTTGRQYGSEVAVDADCDVVVTWTSAGQDGSGFGIFARRYGIVPVLNSSSYVFATAPHRLQFTFDENVSTSLGTDDLVVRNLTTMQTVPASDFSVSYDLPTNIATFSYTGSAAGIAGVLPDGNYRATLLSAGVTTPNGNPLPADHVLNFHFLQGDANHDARVNLDDFNILAANFGQSPRDFAQGDFNYDSIVNLDDFNILAARFGQQVAPGAAGFLFPRQALFGASSIPSRYNEHINSFAWTEEDDGQIELLA